MYWSWRCDGKELLLLFAMFLVLFVIWILLSPAIASWTYAAVSSDIESSVCFWVPPRALVYF